MCPLLSLSLSTPCAHASDTATSDFDQTPLTQDPNYPVRYGFGIPAEHLGLPALFGREEAPHAHSRGKAGSRDTGSDLFQAAGLHRLAYPGDRRVARSLASSLHTDHRRQPDLLFNCHSTPQLLGDRHETVLDFGAHHYRSVRQSKHGGEYSSQLSVQVVGRLDPGHDQVERLVGE